MSLPIEVQAVQIVLDRLATLSLVDQGMPVPVSVYKRSLDGTDPNFSIGMFFSSWAPTPQSAQIGQIEPGIGRYTFGIQAYLKADNRDAGERWMAVLVKRLRNLVYRDPDLRQQLGSLSEMDPEVPAIERTLRFGINQVEYADSAISGGFAYLSQTEFFLETEVA